MEERYLKMIFCKSGGNAKNGISGKISIPIAWIREMDITPENRELKAVFTNNKIVVTSKNRNESESENIIEVISNLYFEKLKLQYEENLKIKKGIKNSNETDSKTFHKLMEIENKIEKLKKLLFN